MKSEVMTGHRRAAIVLLLLIVFLAPSGRADNYPEGVAPRVSSSRVENPIPLMAYYYIWFDTQSWNRAKTDFPLLGRYSSDDQAVMEQHIRWAKEAGIDGFIVSWKSTFKLDRRLEQLLEIADREGFYLWIIYQGLDFERRPLSVDRIGDDLEFFLEHFADHPSLHLYSQPLVIWSGTWEFSRQQVEAITSSYGEQLLILASERNLEGYQRLADLVAGNAYYWSSVNPVTFPTYQQKLMGMSAAVHRRGGIWLAPAAPGFDARLLGGSTVVERLEGATLQTQLDTALRSAPDAIGLISWNEFSENTHIEPSQRYGTQALDLLAGREVTTPPALPDFDSSAPATTSPGAYAPLLVVGGTLLFILFSIALALLRHRQDVDLDFP